MINLQQLSEELTNDPKSMGYLEFINSGADGALADLLNSKVGPGAETVREPIMSRGDFLLTIASVLLEIPTKSSEVQTKWDRILATVRSVESIRITSQPVQVLLSLAVQDGLLSQEIVDNLGKRVGSRAEVLFGSGTFVNHTDIAAALGRGV